MRIWFHIRNHWQRWHTDRWYLLGIGYHIQEPRLVVWQLWLLGFRFCMFVETKEPRSRPFPLSWFDWKRAVRRKMNAKGPRP